MKVRNELNMLLYSQKANGHDETALFPNDYIPIRLGDAESTKAWLESGKIRLYNNVRRLSENRQRNDIYNFILKANETAETAVSAGMSNDEASALADIYINKADRCSDSGQLINIFSDMCIDYAERIREITADTSASPHIRKCKAYIYGNLNGDLSVKGLAEITGLNPSYLSKLFSEEVGIPIKKFVTKAKTDTVKNLLRYTGLSYIEIAYSLGFSSQSTFIRTFKRETGMTPKKYREKFLVI